MLNKYDISERKRRKLFKSLCCFMCLLCINFFGCNSGSNVAEVPPDSKPPVQAAVEPNDTASAATELDKVDTDIAQIYPITDAPHPVQGVPEQHSNSIGQDFTLGIELLENNTIIELPEIIDAATDTKTEPASVQSGVNIPILEEPGMADKLISVNFDQVDIRTMLRTIGDITGIAFVVDDNVRGTVTVMSPTKIRLGDLYNVLQSILEVKGYAAVPSGSLVKIIPRAEATKKDLEVRVGADPAMIPLGDFLVTQIIPIKYADAADIVRIIRQRLAKDAQIAAYQRTNSILITDTSSNIHHIAEIIEKLDVTGSQEGTTVIALKYASAQVLSEQITQILEKSKTALQTAGRTRDPAQIATETKIFPYERTNSLIIVANAKNTDTVRSLIMQLDIQRPRGANNVHVVYLQNAEAQETAESLTKALVGLRITNPLEANRQIYVTADEGTNALIITASKQDFEVISEIIEKLDIARQQVYVEMVIVEVSEDALIEIGIDWATMDDAVAGSIRFFGSTGFGPRADFLSGDLEGLAIGAFRASGTDTVIGPILHALEKKSGVNILSTPHITTSNHQKARIVVGENRPFVMKTRITETDPSTPTVIKTFEYKDVGIMLEITPHISQGGLVRLEIDSKFTKLVDTVTTLSLDTPTTAIREAQTVVSMNSGSTITIGGLIRDDKVTIEKKIPILGDLPIVGPLFRFRREQVQKTNLMIFITPHILPNRQNLDQTVKSENQRMMSNLEEFNKNVSKN